MPLGLAVLLAWALSGALGLRWSRPLSFGGDHLFLLLHGRLFLDWPDILRNPHLGFPGAIDLLAFPFTDLTQRVVQAAHRLGCSSIGLGISVKDNEDEIDFCVERLRRVLQTAERL